jgi:hypothetical protein
LSHNPTIFVIPAFAGMTIWFQMTGKQFGEGGPCLCVNPFGETRNPESRRPDYRTFLNRAWPARDVANISPDSRAGHGCDSVNSRGESGTSAQWFIHETLRSNLRLIATN